MATTDPESVDLEDQEVSTEMIVALKPYEVDMRTTRWIIHVTNVKT